MVRVATNCDRCPIAAASLVARADEDRAARVPAAARARGAPHYMGRPATAFMKALLSLVSAPCTPDAGTPSSRPIARQLLPPFRRASANS